MEIERRFKLKNGVSADVLSGKEKFSISQGYGKKIRVRSKNEKCFITIKDGHGLVRKEWEAEIPRWVFDKLWEETDGRFLEKDRYVIPYGEHTLELDVYKGKLVPLVVLECEFKTEDDARAFVLPDWARDVSEITDDERYANRQLATHGLPVD